MCVMVGKYITKHHYKLNVNFIFFFLRNLLIAQLFMALIHLCDAHFIIILWCACVLSKINIRYLLLVSGLPVVMYVDIIYSFISLFSVFLCLFVMYCHLIGIFNIVIQAEGLASHKTRFKK